MGLSSVLRLSLQWTATLINHIYPKRSVTRGALPAWVEDVLSRRPASLKNASTEKLIAGFDFASWISELVEIPMADDHFDAG
jgi:hypothetical protein